MLIKPVLKNEKKNDTEIIEDKTEIDRTETENKCNDSLNIVVMIIWISDSSSFFSE